MGHETKPGNGKEWLIGTISTALIAAIALIIVSYNNSGIASREIALQGTGTANAVIAAAKEIALQSTETKIAELLTIPPLPSIPTETASYIPATDTLVVAPQPVLTNAPTSSNQVSPSSVPTSTLVCMKFNALEKLGLVIEKVYFPDNVLAGAQIAFNQDWTAPHGWIIEKERVKVPSVLAGDVATAWSPPACRPLS